MACFLLKGNMQPRHQDGEQQDRQPVIPHYEIQVIQNFGEQFGEHRPNGPAVINQRLQLVRLEQRRAFRPGEDRELVRKFPTRL